MTSLCLSLSFLSVHHCLHSIECIKTSLIDKSKMKLGGNFESNRMQSLERGGAGGGRVNKTMSKVAAAMRGPILFSFLAVKQTRKLCEK